MEYISSNISTLVIKKGQWVLDAIVAIAKKNGISYTRRELYSLGSQVCANLDRDKLRQDCVVQPRQVIQIDNLKKIETPIPTIKTETLIWDGVATGLMKEGNTYTLNGEKITRI